MNLGGGSARAPPAPQGPQLGPAVRAGSGPGGSDVPIEHGRLRAGSAQLTYRDVSGKGAAQCASPHAPIPISAKVRAITTLRINYSRCYLKIFRARRSAVAARSPSRHGVAHANRFPAAGRLMRAGRAGAGGGSDARAHRRPSLSGRAAPHRSERDHDTSLSQRRLVNTNRLRSRDKIFDLHFTTHTSAAAALVAMSPTHARRGSRIARHSSPARSATFDNFSRKLTCTVTVDEARPPATWPLARTSIHFSLRFFAI